MNALSKFLMFLAIMMGIALPSSFAEIWLKQETNDFLLQEIRPLIELYKKNKALFIQKEIIGVADFDVQMAWEKKSDLRLLSLLCLLTGGGCCLLLISMFEKLNDMEFKAIAGFGLLNFCLSSILTSLSIQIDIIHGVNVLKTLFAFYHPSDCEFVCVNDKKSYNFRLFIPQELQSLFDAFYQNYVTLGDEYLQEQAPNIMSTVKAWYEHKNSRIETNRILSDLNETIQLQQ